MIDIKEYLFLSAETYKLLKALLSRILISMVFLFMFSSLSPSRANAYIPDHLAQRPGAWSSTVPSQYAKGIKKGEIGRQLVLLAEADTGVMSDTGPDLTDTDAEGEDDFGFEEEFKEITNKKIIDPLSGYNRFMTQFNDKLYFWALRPMAKGYRAIVPMGVRKAINRFFVNLLFPVRFVNNLLQLKFRNAGTELARFGINSTVGVLGLGDPAKEWFDLDPHPEDFGQTLGHYGVGPGFHIVLPFWGPSNLRDLAGMVPDHFLEPQSYDNELDSVDYVKTQEEEWLIRAYDEVNYRSLHIGEYESLKKDALDLYPFLRDAYEQNRIKEVKE